MKKIPIIIAILVLLYSCKSNLPNDTYGWYLYEGEWRSASELIETETRIIVIWPWQGDDYYSRGELCWYDVDEDKNPIRYISLENNNIGNEPDNSKCWALWKREL